MYMLAKFGDYSCLIEIEISILTLILTRIPWIITASIRHVARFLKPGTPIYNYKIPVTAGRKTTTRRRTQANAKRFAFHTNAITC